MNERNSSNSRSRSGTRASIKRDRIRGYKCRIYHIFAKDCPTTAREERETEQVQQMFNLDKEQTLLKTVAADTYDGLNHVSSLEEVRSEHLKL